MREGTPPGLLLSGMGWSVRASPIHDQHRVCRLPRVIATCFLLQVGTMVVLCDVGVLGFMHYAGLQFNSVTCIVLVLAVGIAVDYSAHGEGPRAALVFTRVG